MSHRKGGWGGEEAKFLRTRSMGIANEIRYGIEEFPYFISLKKQVCRQLLLANEGNWSEGYVTYWVNLFAVPKALNPFPLHRRLPIIFLYCQLPEFQDSPQCFELAS